MINVDSNILITACWNRLFPGQTAQQHLLDALLQAYSEPSRHYHTAAHIAAMLRQSDSCAEMLQDKMATDLAILYHDIVYDASRKDNEEASAERAAAESEQLGVTGERIARITELIHATKHHTADGPINDMHYLLDFDLGVLGAAPHLYDAYASGIRMEYSIYPDALYNPGRKAVLAHFLEMEFIYKTPFFRERFEAQARVNLQREHDNL